MKVEVDFEVKNHYPSEDNPLAGWCYVASEVLYHVLGGKEAGWKAVQMQHEGVSHWFLEHEDGTIVDITAGQFEVAPKYKLGKGRGFLTKKPSKRAQAILARMREKKDGSK
jgi:hypothetical protein